MSVLKIKDSLGNWQEIDTIKGDKGDTGNQGAQGIPGVSPTVTVTDITGGHRITITDAEYPQGVSFDVMDGSDADAPVQDVQVNGVSVLNNKIGNIPRATNTTLGVVRGGSGVGINPNSGEAYILKAYDNIIQPGEGAYSPIVPYNQHRAVFFGLSKVAGADLKNETVTLGAYPDTAKAAIRNMIGVGGDTLIIPVSGTVVTITAENNCRYVCGEVLTIDITAPASGICDIVFTSGSTVAVLTSTGITWPEWFDASVLETDTVYEINIADGRAVIATWPTS